MNEFICMKSKHLTVISFRRHVAMEIYPLHEFSSQWCPMLITNLICVHFVSWHPKCFQCFSIFCHTEWKPLNFELIKTTQITEQIQWKKKTIKSLREEDAPNKKQRNEKVKRSLAVRLGNAQVERSAKVELGIVST